VAAKQATREIPIVMAETGDPIGTGLIMSLPRPGGNVTGIASVTAELAGKSVQLIRDMLPSARRVTARMRERPKKRIGRPPLPDEKLVSEIKAVIAELPTYGYRRVHAILKRQALAAGLKPSNHKRIYRVMSATAAGAPTALRLAATTVNACGSPSRSIAVIARP
jgi:hypothetical protein